MTPSPAAPGSSSAAPVPGDGNFFAPVVLADVPHDARMMREEIFGPIAAIAAVDTEEEALRLANAHTAGLAAYLFTTDLARAMRLGGRIQAGMIAINRGRVSGVAAPFGGSATPDSDTPAAPRASRSTW